MFKISLIPEPTLLKTATIAAVIISCILVVGKFFAYWLSGSLTIQASLIDSCLDGFISVVNFFAIKRALRPADPQHRFGHGKIEALAGLLQSLFIMGTGTWLLIEVVQKLIRPEPILYHPIAILTMGVGSILVLLLVLWQRFVIKKTNSLVVAADCLHYQTDLYVNIGVIISFLFSSTYNIAFIDSLTATIIAFYIMKTAYTIGKSAFDILMDKELSADCLSKIHSLLQSTNGIKEVKEIRTRSSGRQTFIQLHYLLESDLSLAAASILSDDVKKNIQTFLPGADIIVDQSIEIKKRYEVAA